MVYEMLDTEGIYIGASSALNVVAAYELAKELGPGLLPLHPYIYAPILTGDFSLGHTIVTILCDGAYRYQSRLFSKKWLESKGLDNAIPENLKKYAVLD